jgi:tetratricopeptide (TPR) repeat protein
VRATCSEAIRLDPGLARAFRGRGNSCGAKGNHAFAKRDYDEAIRLDPTDDIAVADRAYAYWAEGDFDRAIDAFDRAVQLSPRNAETFVQRATAYESKEMWARAIMDYDEALRLAPEDPAALNDRCHGKAVVGPLESALADCEESLGRTDTGRVGGCCDAFVKEVKPHARSASAQTRTARRRRRRPVIYGWSMPGGGSRTGEYTAP